MDSRASRRTFKIALVGVPAAIALLAMALSRVVDAPDTLWNTAWTASTFSALCATLMARTRAEEHHRLRWSVWAAGVGFALAAQLVWDIAGAALPASPNLNDIGDWIFALLMIAGVIVSVALSPWHRLVAAVETVPLIAAALALSCAELWPYVHSSALGTGPVASALVYPGLYVAAVIVTLQALISGWLRGANVMASRLVLVGLIFQAAAFTLWGRELLQSSYTEGHSLLDPLWVLGMLAIACGGTLARRTPVAEPPPSSSAPRGGILPGVMFLIVLGELVKAVLGHNRGVPTIALASGLLLCGASMMLRGHLLAQRLQRMLERERDTVADLAERESMLTRLNARLVEDSRHDALTGMRNRRALGYDLPRIEADHLRRDDSFAIAVCDVDHFKAYNDRLGHLAGDHALRGLAATIRGELRDGDLGYRFGGEELLLVLPSTRVDEAVSAAERVRAAVEAAALPHPEGVDGILTVSVGVASGCEPAATLLGRADAALYEAKAAGRNRVMAANGAQSHAVVRERRSTDEESVPRQLRSMLAVSRAAASGLGVVPVLKALAETIRLELHFEVVAVNLRHFERDQIEAVVVLGDGHAQAALYGSVNPWSAMEAVMRPQHERCGAYWLPAGSHDFDDLQIWDPEPSAGDREDPLTWREQDTLLLPVRGAHGEVLAVVSVDRPRSGRRPVDGDISVLMAVADHAGLALERAQRDSEQDPAKHEQSVELRLAAVMLLAETLDLRDPGTGRHARTVGSYARRTAVALGLPENRVERVYAAGVLHDLGKLGIADAILYKAGPLDEPEWREMKRHPEVGARILDHAGLLDIARWVRSHHERIDGLGYPDRLGDEQIPLEAKILAVADAYEAMIAERPYRRAMSVDQAREELVRCSGSQFDPGVVSAFLSAAPELESELDDLRILA